MAAFAQRQENEMKKFEVVWTETITWVSTVETDLPQEEIWAALQDGRLDPDKDKDMWDSETELVEIGF